MGEKRYKTHTKEKRYQTHIPALRQAIHLFVWLTVPYEKIGGGWSERFFHWQRYAAQFRHMFQITLFKYG